MKNAMNPDDIKALIEAALPGATVSVSGEGGKYEATVVSDAFDGMNTVKRHQRVYQIVNEHIASGAIHALSIKALLPDEA